MSERPTNETDTETEHDTTDDPTDSETSSRATGTGRGNADVDSGFGLPFSLDMGSSGNVGIREGISYGLGLIVYIVGLVLITSVLSAVGGTFLAGGIAADNAAILLLLGLFGFVVSVISLVLFFAGFAGLQYKIIADAVSRGNEIE